MVDLSLLFVRRHKNKISCQCLSFYNQRLEYLLPEVGMVSVADS